MEMHRASCYEAKEKFQIVNAQDLMKLDKTIKSYLHLLDARLVRPTHIQCALLVTTISYPICTHGIIVNHPANR